MDAQIERAKALLKSVLPFENLRAWLPVKDIMSTARYEHIPKAAVRQARKELGVLSMAGADGEQYWAHPSRIGLPEDEP